MVDKKLKKIKNASLVSILACVLLLLVPSLAQAFLVKKIEIEGSNRIGIETINSYLSISEGDFLDSRLSQESIRSLYKTGFFKDVGLYKKDEETLVVRVVERPSISEVTMEGNQLISSENLIEVLDSLRIKTGRIFNQIALDRVIVDLKRRYQNQGYYAAEIKIESKLLPRNRIALKIKVIEGEPAEVGRIVLIGNKTFSDKRIKAQIQIAEGDAYSKPKLQGDLEVITSYYMDRGYVRFKIRSSQISISNDKTKVFITINIDEGALYTIDKIQFTGELIVGEADLYKLIEFKTQDAFSRNSVIKGINAIRDRLSEEGYAFSEVVPDTIIDDKAKTIALNFRVEPKHRVYIRRVLVEGNTRTRDYVIRREMHQLESAPYSLKLVRQSKLRLNRLGFFKAVTVETKRVSFDQVDLIVKVKEQATGSFSAGIGFSQLDGVSFNLSVSERNFLGSGDKLDVSLATSKAKKMVNIGITNPYFTDDGVSLGGSFYLSQVNAEELDIADYTINNVGVKVILGYPLSELASISYGLKLDSQELVCSSNFIICNDYLATYGKNSSATIASVNWNHNTTNSFYFSSKGHKIRLSLEAVLPSTSDVSFYKMYADESWYYPVSKNFTFKLKGALAYGDGYGSISKLPFYQRFYAGGIGSVRGFAPNSLGGHYDLKSEGSDRPIGGSVKLATTVAIIFPVPLIENSSNVRMSIFFDMGNIFNDFDSVKLDKFRSSVGIGISWITPVGPLSFGLMQPVGYSSEDRIQTFQFSLGGTL